MWTFGRKIALGFAVSFALLLAIGLVAHRVIDKLTETSHWVAHTYEVLDHVGSLIYSLADAETEARGFALSGDEAFLDAFQGRKTAVDQDMVELRRLTADNANQQQRLAAAEPLIAARFELLKRTVELRRQNGLESAAKFVSLGEGKRTMDALRRLAGEIEADERRLLKLRADEVEAASSGARTTILAGTLLCLLFVAGAGAVLTGSLTNQIGSAVQQVQRSTNELQTAANQQAAGARESATSMTEITTTINELLATSRQIAESAQRVATVAEQTVNAARAGDGTVELASASIMGIRQQVDLVVNHMLELGRKSQQIGAVLDIVSELAEQTNILAINATIEASGAGEGGRRFGVVADEIRKLADRVAASTKEIRILIDDVRSAVNTTVMATETGSKAVDAGSSHFADVTKSFKHIAGMVANTTEAAREIELSTKQQTSAVEQINLAIANTAQATKETEASSGQTFQTASQLALLAKELLRLVTPRVAT